MEFCIGTIIFSTGMVDLWLWLFFLLKMALMGKSYDQITVRVGGMSRQASKSAAGSSHCCARYGVSDERSHTDACKQPAGCISAEDAILPNPPSTGHQNRKHQYLHTLHTKSMVLDEICCFTSAPEGTSLMPPTDPFRCNCRLKQHMQHIY